MIIRFRGLVPNRKDYMAQTFTKVGLDALLTPENCVLLLIVVILCLMFIGADFVSSELPPRDHVHYELKTNAATGPTTIGVAPNAESARVIYSSEARNRSRPGQMSDPRYFPTVAAAQEYGIRLGYVSAYIVSATGSYVWHPIFNEWLSAS